jgi:hypothetical protein
MQDNDCTLCTLGHFAKCQPSQVSAITGYMDGAPLGETAVTDMIQRLGFSQVEPEVFNNLNDAINYMMEAMSSDFAFGCIPHGGLGHMVCAFRTNGGIELRDYQNNGAAYNPPAGTIYIWQIFQN